MKPSVLHVGNAPDGPGGIASVIRRHLTRSNIHAQAASSYDPRKGSWVAKSAPSVAAALLILRVPKNVVVHVHVSNKGSLLREGLLAVLARLNRHPVVVTLHGSGMTRASSLERWGLRALCAQARAVHLLSPSFSGVSHSTREIIIPNDVELTTPRCFTERQSFVVSVGEVGHRKGLDVLLDLGPLLPPNVRLRLIGPPSPGLTDESREKLSSAQGIDWLGAVSPEVARAEIGQSLLLINPSRGEAFPMVVCEALASGTPVIGTDVGGQGQLLRVSGQDIVGLDAVELAGRVASLVNDIEKWNGRSRAAVTYANAHLESGLIAERWEELYREVEHPRRPSR